MRPVSRREFLKLSGAGFTGAVLLGVVGCGEGEGGGEGNETVEFLTERAESTAQEREAQRIVERFNEQNPNFNVERESIPVEDIRSVIQTRLQSNQAPDFFNYDTGPGFGGVLADAELVQPLEEAYNENGWEVFDWAKQRATYDGTAYGVPDHIEELVVFYNKSLFDEIGADEPKTVDELRQIAEELKGRDIIPLAFGDQEQWPAGHIFSIGVNNILGRGGIEELIFGDGRWDSPEIVKAIDLMFRDFVENGYYPSDVNAISYDDVNTLFYSGQAAMVPTGTWLVSEITQTVQDFEVDFFPFPSIEGSSITPPAGVGSGLFVSANANNPEGAIEYIDYLLQDDTARLIAERLQTIPAHPIENTEDLDVPELFQKVLDDLSESPGAEDFGYNIDVLAPQNFNEVMFTGFQEVIGGSRSPEEQAAALQEAWAQAKEEGNTPTQE